MRVHGSCLCKTVFCLRQVKRNFVKTLNMNEQASVPHQANVSAAARDTNTHTYTHANTTKMRESTHRPPEHIRV